MTSQLIDKFDSVKLELIPREENSAVDEIARLASIEDASATVDLLMKVQTTPSIDELQALSIQRPSPIRDGQLPSGSLEVKKIKFRVARFIILNGELYKKGFSMPYLKCLNPVKATYVLREIHEGICDDHFKPLSLVGKTIRASYFWLTI